MLERYDESFDPADSDSLVEILIPMTWGGKLAAERLRRRGELKQARAKLSARLRAGDLVKRVHASQAAPGIRVKYPAVQPIHLDRPRSAGRRASCQRGCSTK